MLKCMRIFMLISAISLIMQCTCTEDDWKNDCNRKKDEKSKLQMFLIDIELRKVAARIKITRLDIKDSNSMRECIMIEVFQVYKSVIKEKQHKEP